MTEISFIYYVLGRIKNKSRVTLMATRLAKYDRCELLCDKPRYNPR